MSNYRAPLRTLQTDFRSGAVDPMFAMHVDTKINATGARQLTNMLLRATGGVERRPGTSYVVKISARSRLVDFQFDANEKYCCAFTADGIVRFFNQAGTEVDAITGAPWTTTARVWEMNFVQRGDVMIVVHNQFKPQRITRVGLNSFTLAPIDFGSDTGSIVLRQPFMRFDPTPAALMLSDTAIGTGRTLTASVPTFSAAWVGEHLQLWGCDLLITSYTNSTHVTVAVRQKVEQKLGIAPFLFTAGSGWVSVTHAQHGLVAGASVTISGAVDAFGLTAAQINGTHPIDLVDADHYWVNLSAAPTSGGDGGGASVRVSFDPTSKTVSWKEQAWSGRHGWPGAIALHERRLWLAGSPDLPTFIAGSAVGDYRDFSVGDGFDDDSVQGVIAATSRIVHLVSAKELQVFCENSEAVTDTREGEPITPATLKVVQQTSYGADPSVRPVPFDGATLFAQRNGKNVREFAYDFNSDAHVASPVSILASNLINKPHDLAVLLGTPTRPEQYAFFVNADGTIALFHSIRSEQLAAWTQWKAGGGGRFDSICVFGSTVFISVLRNGDYWIEKLELDRPDWWLDGAISVSGTASDWPLGVAFANRTVVAMNPAGWSLGVHTADAAGTVHLDRRVEGPLQFGYDPGVTLVTSSPDKEMTDGGMTGEKRRIVSTTMHFHDTGSAAINGVEMAGFQIGHDPSAPPVRFTGKRRVVHLGYDRDPRVTLTQPNPGRLIVLGMTQEVSI